MKGSKETATQNRQAAASNGHREDILNAAIEVFGKVGYAAASTNEIVKRAKVSKGLLFHHFTNKEKLYTACQLYVMEEYSRFMTKYIDLSGTDFFERILSNLRVKIEFGRQNPGFLALINRAWYADGDESTLTRKAAEEYVLQSMQGGALAALFEGIDTKPLRDGLDFAKVLAYTRMTLEAGWVQYSKNHQNDIEAMMDGMDGFLAECEEIILLLRDGAYKPDR